MALGVYPAPAVHRQKTTVEAEADTYGSSYNSWVGHGDVLYFVTHAGLYAAPLRVAG